MMYSYMITMASLSGPVGGLAHGESPSRNVVKECFEEASIPASLASRAEPAGVVSYVQLDETGRAFDTRAGGGELR